jgi:imidazole glycerol-phosphate synthase subunit HisF
VSQPRLIPVVTLLGDQAVKTREFLNPRYVGDPVNTTALLSSFEVEELIVLDISKPFEAAPASEKTLVQIIENAFMPIAYGGGIASYHDAERKFNLGFDKVVLRSNLFKDDLSLQISEKYGSQAVSGCLDVSYPVNRPTKMIVNGEEYEISYSEELLAQVAKLGIGELIIQDINREGTRIGLREHPLLAEAINKLKIPVVPLGGCNSVDEAAHFLQTSKSHSIAASTMFLFRPTREAILVSYPNIDRWHELIREKS